MVPFPSMAVVPYTSSIPQNGVRNQLGELAAVEDELRTGHSSRK